jgi:hypothetical protein
MFASGNEGPDTTEMLTLWQLATGILLFGRKWCFKLDDTKSCRDYIYSELRHRSDEEEDEIEEEDNDGTNVGSLGSSSSSSNSSRRNCDSSRSGRSEIELSAVK